MSGSFFCCLQVVKSMIAGLRGHRRQLISSTLEGKLFQYTNRHLTISKKLSLSYSSDQAAAELLLEVIG